MVEATVKVRPRHCRWISVALPAKLCVCHLLGKTTELRKTKTLKLYDALSTENHN